MAGADGPMRSPPATADAASSVLDRLAQRRMVIVSGKGGVGRTTLAALLGIALADRGKKVLVATTGHDDRLAWMLGAKNLTDAPQAITDRLLVQRLVPQTCIREYGSLVLRSQRISTAVFDNRIVRKLLRAIPGLDDFAVIGKAWHEGIRGGEYDTIIFDGPATGHLLYSLGVPGAILGTIPPGPLTKEAQLMQSSFEDPSRVEAVLVGLPEAWPLTELSELGGALRQQIRISVAAIVVNGLWPREVPPLSMPEAAQDPHGVVQPVFENVERISSVGRRQHAEIAQWFGSDTAHRCGAKSLLMVPWRWQGVTDMDGLRQLLPTLQASATPAQLASGSSE
jgi:anion-transporting  ArsA/GET3 family ATPase